MVSLLSHSSITSWLMRLTALGLGVCAGPFVSAGVVIDDFTLTGDPSPFPLSLDAAFPTFVQQEVDEFGPIAGRPGFRVLAFAPLLSTEQIQSGVFSGNQTITLDTTAGRLTSTSTGDGAPLLLLGWGNTDLPADGLNLDLTGEEGLRLRYQANKPVNMQLTLTQEDENDSNNIDFKAGSIANITLQPGENSIFVPFTDFNEDLTQNDFSTIPPTVLTLPPIDLAEVDGLSMLISPTTDDTVPEGLVLSFDEVAFVPEPATAGLLFAGTAFMRRRRQR